MVKFDVVSGFLGAGKTTFIKNVLQACTWAEEKIVLIENEFGEVSIDDDILRVEGFDVYEIAHGCVCCTLKGDFIQTLKKILPLKPDRIIFEPSGIFVLREIFQLFQDPEISDQCYINSITTIVDGQAFLRQIGGYSRFLEDQIAHAGTQVVSKTQFLTADELSEVQKQLLEINPTSPVITKDWANFSNPEILLLLDGNIKYGQNSWQDRHVEAHHHRHDHGHDHTAHEHHNHGFETVGFRTSKALERDTLVKFLEELSMEEYGNIIRGKGIIRTSQACLEFNFVDGQFSITESKVELPGIASFIGTGLQRAKLLKALA